MTMPATLRLPPILRPEVGGNREVAVDGETLADALEDLFERYPAVRTRLVDADGNINRFVNVYVDSEDVRLGDGLATDLKPGGTIIVLPAMAGGGR
jgi:molybdopterin converting factor small subunit